MRSNITVKFAPSALGRYAVKPASRPLPTRWATTMPLTRFAILLAIQVLFVRCAIAGQSQDSCRSKVPASLAKALHTKYPELRLPLAKDGEPMQVQLSKKHGHGECVLVATGDFDGNGLADVAVLLKNRRTEKLMLVSALRESGGWSLFELPTWCNSISNCYVAAAGPGKYEMTESFDYTKGSPNSRERIVSSNQVIVSGTPESTGIVHAFVRGQWLYVWVSD
jgi:hypothetical protein